MDPVEPGLACGSDTAHMSIFGYDPRKLYRGRGAFESMGAGMDMIPGDVAFKSNFAVLDEGSGVVVSRRADRNFDTEGPVLCEALNGQKVPGFGGKYTVLVRYATEHRCGVVIRGPGLTDAIHGTDPLKDGLPLYKAIAKNAEDADAVHTAEVVNAASDHIVAVLRNHPVNEERRRQGKQVANVVLLRGCGCRLALESFDVKYGLNSCMIAPTKIIAGLGMCMGIRVMDCPEITGDYRTKLHVKSQMMAGALLQDGHDFGFLHIKAVDDAGHDKEADLKVDCIEAVDAMLGQLIRRLCEGGEDAVVAVTGDHSTPVLFGDHSHEPVPFAMSTVNRIEALLGRENVMDIPLSHLPCPEDIHAGAVNPDYYWKKSIRKVLECCNEEKRSTYEDKVCRFDEIDAGCGFLGRFSGCHVMTTLKSFASA